MLNGEEIKLEGMYNFRELGGYTSKDGRKVKEGIFYRGGVLTTLTPNDTKYIESLNLKHVFDFRSKVEADPKPEPHFGTYHRISPMIYKDGSEVDFSPAGIGKFQALFKKEGKGFELLYFMMLEHNEAFASMFEAIKNQEVPILFHCTAGKDRTGMAAALILLALGVDEDTIIYDYTLTNIYRKPIIDQFIKNHPEMDPDDIRFREGVKESHMRESLALILEKYGTYDNYFKEVYDVDVKKLRDYYLE